ncbi:MAG: hypothetical protein ACK5NT_14640 [Pyrinomonadaceae bacterium]
MKSYVADVRYRTPSAKQSTNRVKIDKFNRFLTWLNPNRELAARNYEAIRDDLNRFFAVRDVHDPNELSDITIDRVMRKIDRIFDTYKGDPKQYFFGVARNVFLEYLRKPRVVELFEETKVDYPSYENDDAYLASLESALENLPAEQARLIIDYYSWSAGNKKEKRALLAASMGLSVEALRVRAYRVRARLRKNVVSILRKREYAPSAKNHRHTVRNQPRSVRQRLSVSKQFPH